MEIKEILSKVDHTQLAVDAKWEDIRELCDDALKFNTASVCIPPAYVADAKKYLGDRMKVCTVIGFPNGYNTTEVKAFEAADAIKNGADEIDMVINVGRLKSGDTDYVLNDIKTVKAACENTLLKVIVENCLLTEDEKIQGCKLVTEAGADYIKTSTGFSKGGATFEDVELMSQNIGEKVKIKAAGGISSLADAEKYIELGCSRLGTSRIVKIAKSEM